MKDESQNPSPLDYAGTNPHGERPEDFKDYFGPSVLATVLIWPIGVVALVYSVRAKQAYRRQQYPDAQRMAASAMHWGMAGMAVWIVGLVLLFCAGLLHFG